MNVHVGLNSIGNQIPGFYILGAEYMFNKNVGIHFSYSTTNSPLLRKSWSVQRLGVDVTYHFLQSKRWDLYGCAGMGYLSTSYSRPSYVGQEFETFSPSPNIAIAARYKVTPSMSALIELGIITSLGISRKFSLKRKSLHRPENIDY